MTRRLFLFIAVVISSIVTIKADVSLIQQADSAYTSDDFATAASLYLKAMDQEGTSAKLYYNLGNCYYRMGEMGNAILSYERALRLDPTDKDIRYNLDFLNSRITDRPGERGTFLGNMLDAASSTVRTNIWAWLALACFGLTVAALLAYLFVDNIAVRKTGFFGGLVTLLGCMVCVFFAYRSSAIALADDVAIVISPSTILSTVPRTPTDRSQEAMLLHEGTKVNIIDSVSSVSAIDSTRTIWYDVNVDNSHRAWINASDVEKVR
ncbi:MAG: tetratricopeptide repeat protein [Muribaculaceae bacterium]|nr:tetratricopeptide repeat protein [Muribaculaceae bacterium]